MRAEGTFSVASFEPAQVEPSPAGIEVALPIGVAVMQKTYDGAVAGRSTTIFTAAFDQQSGVGTYVAMESFEGSLDGRSGGFAFVHSATTTGSDRRYEFFVIVPSSAVGDLAGITGGGGLTVDEDDTHRIWFEYDLP